MQQARFKKASLTQNAQSLILEVGGLSSLIIELTNTFIGTVIFEYTINGVDWYTLTANVIGSPTTATGATAVGKWSANVSGLMKVKVRCTAFTSGSIDVALSAVLSAGPAAGSDTAGATSGASGGATPGKLISAATTNGTNIKASAGKLTMLTVSNINAAFRYLKVYDKATTPTVGTDVPKFTFLIPGGTATEGRGSNIPLGKDGIDFANGIGIALTTGVADADVAAVSANEHVVNYATK